jgi:hypothetical protein
MREVMHVFTRRARQAVTVLTLSLQLLGTAAAQAGQAGQTTPPAAQTAFARPAQTRPFVPRRIPRAPAEKPLAFARTELFFGTARPDGVVTDEEFRDFLDREITSRFPDGLTVVTADGQFRGTDDVVIKERSFVVVLLYPLDTHAASTRKIERIRTLYTTEFQQESVLRVDDPFIVWVSF